MNRLRILSSILLLVLFVEVYFVSILMNLNRAMLQWELDFDPRGHLGVEAGRLYTRPTYCRSEGKAIIYLVAATVETR